MYRVYSRRAVLPAVGCILLGVLLLFGVAGRAMHTSAAKRELPVYSVDTEEKVAALGINCAWDDSDIDKLIGLLDERKIKATFFLVGDWCKKYPEAAKNCPRPGMSLEAIPIPIPI
nr:polysaccharide deacetylase family protein [Anaerotruncus rubiinfantis]